MSTYVCPFTGKIRDCDSGRSQPQRRLSNEDRRDWINNDEGLYSWWKSSRLSLREFVRQNRTEIDSAISRVLDGSKPAHYLRYGG